MADECKKLVNSPSNCVRDNLQGFLLGHSPLLQLTSKRNIVLRRDLNFTDKVLLLSGGGSGHEPTFGGFVGRGMLAATVAGEIFTSPGPDAVLAALKILGKYTAAGVLIIINNYTGDRLNFGLAMGRAKAQGIKVEMLFNHDDCALQSQDKSAGRRGVAGSLLAIKIAGAMAEEGKSLDEIYTFCSNVLDNIGTIGVGLSGCSIPGVGYSFTLARHEIELGLGIHGEAGIKRLNLGTAKEVVKIMIDHMTNKSSVTGFNLNSGDEIGLFINNLGGTSQLEINIVVKEAMEYLGKLGAIVQRVTIGSLMTALEMAGVSITLLRLNDEVRKYLDAETNAPSWPVSYDTTVSPKIYEEEDSLSETNTITSGKKLSTNDGSVLLNVIVYVSEVMKENEAHLNDLDRESGDGDCGSTLKRGFEAVSNYLKANASSVTCPKLLFLRISDLMESSMGGSSGALYSIFCTGASRAFNKVGEVSYNDWKEALNLGLQDICQFGGAEPGDRTMVDPLHEFLKRLPDLNNLKLLELNDIWQQAVTEAERSSEETSTMIAKAGRASYVDQTRLKRPDPGAKAVALWLRAALDSWQKETQILRK